MDGAQREGFLVIYALKPAFVARLRNIEELMVRKHVSANALTAMGLVFAAGSGLAVLLGLALSSLFLLIVPILCIARLAANALDGSIARRTGTSSPAGTVINELGDRAGDALMISGASLIHPSLALAAIASSFLCSLTGVLGELTTGTRLTGGPMGKADRAMLLAIAAPVAFVVSPRVILVWLWIVVLGSLLTAGRRALTCVGGGLGH